MAYLFIPRIKIENASALSSSYTIGVPSMPAWLGMMYAMQRKLREKYFSDITFRSVGVCYHEVKVKRYKPKDGFKYSIIGSRNPLVGKNAAPRSFMEVPTLDMTVDLLYEFDGVDPDETTDETFPKIIRKTLQTLRACGGNITSVGSQAQLVFKKDDEDKLKRFMMPGYTIIERRDLLKDGNGDNIDQMLNALAIYAKAKRDENENFDKWEYGRKQEGWIIPIGVGYKGLSPLGNVENQKDRSYPHRFVEGITTLGECKMPITLETLEDMMWHFDYNEDEALYLCVNEKF